MNSASLPEALNAALQEISDGMAVRELCSDAKKISRRYREETGAGKRLVTGNSEAAAYALSRMPATFAAASAVMKEVFASGEICPHTMLDCGAGTGAVSWAAAGCTGLTKITCLERENAMRRVGAELMQSGNGTLRSAEWVSWDALQDAPLPQADLVAEGYMLGELEKKDRIPAARKLWNAAGMMLILIEPGTPEGFMNLKEIRSALTEEGAYTAAPCPYTSGSCPIADQDWCHFAVRVARNRLHKAMKGGEAAYEDEKFSYLVLTREKPEERCAARVLRHPMISPGRIELTVCGGQKLQKLSITKKDPLWKRARKIAAGDSLNASEVLFKNTETAERRTQGAEEDRSDDCGKHGVEDAGNP